MRPIPPKVKKQILEDPFYNTCCRPEKNECEGRVTWEHALIYAGKQVNELWAIIPLCVYHHLGRGLDKHWNRQRALTRATAEDLAKYPKQTWKLEKE